MEGTKLERFLIQAIKNAREELLEEAEALEEGADAKAVASVMKKVMNDLLDSAENFSSYEVESETDEEVVEDVYREFFEKSDEESSPFDDLFGDFFEEEEASPSTGRWFKFKEGERVTFIGTAYKPDDHLERAFGLDSLDGFGNHRYITKGDVVEIIAKTPSPFDAERNDYIILWDGKKFFVEENDLK